MSPVHYDLTVRPNIYMDDPEDFSFTGTVMILVDVHEETTRVTLHYKYLLITEASIVVKKERDGRVVGVLSATYEKEKDFYHVDLSGPLSKGDRYTIYMEFAGPLTNDLAGIYTSSYTDENGIKQ